MRPLAQLPLQRFSHLDAAAYHHHINILGRTLQEQISHVSSHHITFQPQPIGGGGNLMEYVFVEQLGQLGIRQ